MSEQQTPDREKKIAEIRETVTCFMGAGNDTEYDRALYTLKENAGEWIPFLLLELERLEREYAEERAAHNAHVTELCQLEEKNRKLREERDEARSKAEEAWKEIDSLEDQLQSSQQEIERLRQLYEREREIADQALEQVKNLREERNQDRQWIEKASENVTQLQQERDKMIEWLRMCLFNHGCWREEDYVAYMRNILKEVGVTVE